MHLRESRTSKFSGGAYPRTPLRSKTLRAFGKYTRLLLLSTHLCKNLLKTLHVYYAFEKMQRSCNFCEVSITLYKARLILEQVLQAVPR